MKILMPINITEERNVKMKLKINVFLCIKSMPNFYSKITIFIGFFLNLIGIF